MRIKNGVDANEDGDLHGVDFNRTASPSPFVHNSYSRMALEGIDGQSLAASVAILLLTDEKRASSAKRPSCDLPECFNDVNAKNIVDRTTVAQEIITDKKTGEMRGLFWVATHVKVVEDGVECRFPLESLTMDILRSLVKKLAIKGYCSSTKFRCRQLIGEHVVYQQCYNDEIQENSAAAMKKKLNSELRMIPAFFHPDLIQRQ
jgi:hypothetical protein